MLSESMLLGFIIIGLLVLILLKIPKTPRKYEYLQLSSQEGRATFANGKWLGSLPMDGKTPDAKLFEVCPMIQPYISELCAKGWDLVTVIERVVDLNKNLFFQTYYFKRVM